MNLNMSSEFEDEYVKKIVYMNKYLFIQNPRTLDKETIICSGIGNMPYEQFNLYFNLYSEKYNKFLPIFEMHNNIAIIYTIISAKTKDVVSGFDVRLFNESSMINHAFEKRQYIWNTFHFNTDILYNILISAFKYYYYHNEPKTKYVCFNKPKTKFIENNFYKTTKNNALSTISSSFSNDEIIHSLGKIIGWDKNEF